jgi:hypothetical protein
MKFRELDSPIGGLALEFLLQKLGEKLLVQSAR